MTSCENGEQPEDDPNLRALLDILDEASAERNVLVVASGDLAHIGPAFGTEPVGIIERADLRVHDDALIERLAAGDADGFWDVIKELRGRQKCLRRLTLLSDLETGGAGGR